MQIPTIKKTLLVWATLTWLDKDGSQSRWSSELLPSEYPYEQIMTIFKRIAQMKDRSFHKLTYWAKIAKILFLLKYKSNLKDKNVEIKWKYKLYVSSCLDISMMVFELSTRSVTLDLALVLLTVSWKSFFVSFI